MHRLVRTLLAVVATVAIALGGLALPLVTANPAHASAANVPPGFDHGNQSPNPLTKRLANVNFSTLTPLTFTPTNITPTDDVVGPHLANEPAGLMAMSGINESMVNVAPPDSQVAAGAGFVVEAANTAVTVFNREGQAIRTVSTNRLFGLTATGDPKIVFDPKPTPHWYISIMDLLHTDAGDSVDLAVSHNGDPTGLWDIYLVDNVASNRFADQPRLGFSADKVIVEFTNIDRLTFPSFCFTCFDDDMIVIQKSDLLALTFSPQGVAINMSTETNHRRSVIPSIPLPSAEVPNAFAVYRGTDTLGKYESTLVIVGTPATNDVAFKETGIKLSNGTSDPPPAAQPGVSPNQIDTGDDRMLSVSLVSASSAAGNFSGVLWSADATACTPLGSKTARACARIDKVIVNTAGVASIPKGFDFDIGQAGSDILYPAVVGDVSGNHVWVADTITGSVFPTSELRLLSFTPGPVLLMHTVHYGSGAAAYTIDRDSGHNNLSRFGDYSGIFVDSSETSGATVWAATENAAVGAGKGWTTSLVEATFLPPKVLKVTANSGFAGQSVLITGNDFSRTTAIRFGGVPASQVSFFGSDRLTAVVPAQPPTTVNVFATTVLGTNTPLPGPPLPFPGVPDRFTYKFLLWASGNDPAGNVVSLDPIADTREFTFNTGGGATQGIAMSPDATTVYTVSPGSAVFGWGSTTNGTLTGTMPLGVQPTEIAVSDDGNWAFVTDPGAFGGAGGVIPVQLNTTSGTPSPQAAIPVTDPRGVAAAPNGTVYVTSGSAGKVVILSFMACPVTKKWCPSQSVPIPLSGTPGPIAAGPDRMWLGVTGAPGTPPGTVYSINFAATPPALSAGIVIDGAPTAMTVSPSGAFVFAIASSIGHAFPIDHAPPATDKLLSPVALPNGPLGGGAVSFDNTLLFVAGGASSDINKAGVPGPYISAVTSGPATSAEIATNVPPNTSCGSANFTDPSTALTFSQTPAKAGTLVTATASILSCPPASSGPGTAIPTFTVAPPPSSACPSFTDTQARRTMSAGVVSFSFQFPAKCAGSWKVTASLASFLGGGTPPPAFKSAPFSIST